MDIGLADFGVGFVYGIVYKGGNKVYLNSFQYFWPFSIISSGSKVIKDLGKGVFFKGSGYLYLG